MLFDVDQIQNQSHQTKGIFMMNRTIQTAAIPFRKKLMSKTFNALFRGLAYCGRQMPNAKKQLSALEIIRDVPYGDLGEDQLLDIYIPPKKHEGLRPAVFYVHGGGFVILSKDTHWSLALKFAQEDFVVFTINYRLAPTFACPTALEDSAKALLWVYENAEKYGVDRDRMILAGESAGGNLVTSLCLCTLKDKGSQVTLDGENYQAPWAKKIYELKKKDGSPWQPIAMMPACGFLQSSTAERYQGKVHPIYYDRITYVAACYLQNQIGLLWADPVVEFENDDTYERPIPPFCIIVGTADPVMDDSIRLHQALRKRNVESQCHIHEGGVHAFHAFIQTKIAGRAWHDYHLFLEKLMNQYKS